MMAILLPHGHFVGVLRFEQFYVKHVVVISAAYLCVIGAGLVSEAERSFRSSGMEIGSRQPHSRSQLAGMSTAWDSCSCSTCHQAIYPTFPHAMGAGEEARLQPCDSRHLAETLQNCRHVGPTSMAVAATSRHSSAMHCFLLYSIFRKLLRSRAWLRKRPIDALVKIQIPYSWKPQVELRLFVEDGQAPSADWIDF